MDQRNWWQKAVFYQIYPRSFSDGTGDGIGDFKGMIDKLDYLKWLGIDAIWLSPHYPSPQYDCGYDIADYTGVEPDYGTLDDFKRFLEGCHQRGLRVILDLVLNHTSHLHQWFLESRASRDNPKRDWYIWRDGVGDGPPNNWNSTFGGSAWEYDPQSQQYYYHFFFKEQPDLNWRNPEVKQAMFDAARFWLEIGVDGFRLDALGTIFEDPDMPDHLVPYTFEELGKMSMEAKDEEDHQRLRKNWEEMFQYQVAQPGLHEIFKDLRKVADQYGHRLLVAEDDDIAFMGAGDDEIHLVFNFPLMRADRMIPAHIRTNQMERLARLARLQPPGWPCNTLGNHDSPRLFNRFGDGVNDLALAKLNLALMLTLKGTPFLYNGEEIGMTDMLLEDIAQFRDRLGVFYYNALTAQLGMPADQAIRIAAQGSRDKNRTPMQWDNAPNAGFCPEGITPWLPVNPNFLVGVNVADQAKDPSSLLSFYRLHLALRKSTPALIAGDFKLLAEDNEDCLVFIRSTGEQTCLVILNYSPRQCEIDLSEVDSVEKILYSNHLPPNQFHPLNQMQIQPFEILIADIT
jgi:alpha-glucosidase